MATQDQSPQQPETAATIMQVRALIRRRLRRRPPHEENFLNIYPMMDMMTILLVFLIMQFSTTAADIVQSAELQIPYSTSTTETTQAVPIQITTTSITVEGEEVVQLRNGQVDPSEKVGGGSGFLIRRLEAVMKQHRDRLKIIAQQQGEPFRGEVSIIADKRTPFRTLAEVIYTVGQAEFKTMRFVLLKRGG